MPYKKCLKYFHSTFSKAYTSEELAAMFGGMSDKLNNNTMDLLYLYYFSTIDKDPAWKLSIYEMFDYLSNNLMEDPRFDAFIDNLSKKCDASFGGNYYLIGNSPMSYEMSQTFDRLLSLSA